MKKTIVLKKKGRYRIKRYFINDSKSYLYNIEKNEINIPIIDYFLNLWFVVESFNNYVDAEKYLENIK